MSIPNAVYAFAVTRGWLVLCLGFLQAALGPGRSRLVLSRSSFTEHRVKRQVREESGDLLDHAQRGVCASLQLDGERYTGINLHRDHVAIRERSRRRREHYP
jgi:hypothetical protein